MFTVYQNIHFPLSRRLLETELQTIQAALSLKEEEAQKFQQALQVSNNALVELEKRFENQELVLQSSQRSMSDMEEQMESARQKVQDSRATVRQQEADLNRLREVLRRTEKELDERVAHLEQRCLFSEEERSMFTKMCSQEQLHLQRFIPADVIHILCLLF